MSLTTVRRRMKRAKFVKNAMYTMIYTFNFSLPKALATLIKADKNEKRTNFETKSAYDNYLKN